MSVVTRLAPSPTGFLHIGGARMAPFNRLSARHRGGAVLPCIADTDRAWSSKQAVDTVSEGTEWPDQDRDGEAVFQSAGMNGMKDCAKTLAELAGSALLRIRARPLALGGKAAQAPNDAEARIEDIAER